MDAIRTTATWLTLMLAGTHWASVLKSLGILGLYALVLFLATVRTLRKTLD